MHGTNRSLPISLLPSPLFRLCPPSMQVMASNTRTQFQDSITTAALRSYLAEFISTFLFVLATVGSAMSARKAEVDAMTVDAPAALVSMALAQGFALFAAIFVAADISRGHVNPAVTFAFTVAGQIGIPTAIFYCLSQMTAATLACLVLHLVTAEQAVLTTGIAQEMTGFGAAVLESMFTFALVYTVLFSKDLRTRKCPPGAAAGTVHAACVLAAGEFTGGLMNPARSFGPAVVSGSFKNQAVYWVGPLAGAAVAALLHQNLMFPPAEDECNSSAMAAGGP